MSLASKFKLYGFAINKEACDYITDAIAGAPLDNGDEIIQYLITSLQRHNFSKPFVDVEACTQLLRDCPLLNKNQSANPRLSIYDAFEMPRVVLEESSNRYHLTTSRPRLFSPAEQKVTFFRARFNLIHRCLGRNPIFQSAGQSKLTSIETLIAKEEERNVLVFGMLYQQSENQWFLEDLTAKIPTNLKNTIFKEGFYYDGCFVLVEGFCQEKVLISTKIGYPLPENRLKSRQVLEGFGDSDLLGSLESDPRGDGMAVFLSDVFLDDKKTFEKLDKLFEGFCSHPPLLFVFCGNFMGKSYSSCDMERLKQLFGTFASLLVKHRRILNNSTFLFVPGPSDPVFGDILPRPPIPDSITETLRALSPSTILFRSNPCRIRLFCYSIVICRSDAIHKMSRASIASRNSDSLPSNVATTVLSQYHLSPTSPYMSPVHWGYDNALLLYPHPDLLVLADGGCKAFSFDTYEQTGESGTIIVNPDSFCNSDFSFKIFDCATRSVENSQIG